MALTISEDELLQMPSDLLRRLREYLSKQRGLGEKADSNVTAPISSSATLSRDAPAKLEICSDKWEPEAAEGLALQELRYKSGGKHFGVRVSQHVGTECHEYCARNWLLTQQVKDIVLLAIRYGFDKLWRKGHPQTAYCKVRKDGGPEVKGGKYDDGSPHIGFSSSIDGRWLFVLGAEARPPNVKVITFEKGNEEYLKKILTTELAPRMPIREGAWQWEGRGGNNIFVHPSDLEKILKGIKELQG